MNLSDFDTTLMTTKTVFDVEKVTAGDIISLYKIDASAEQGTPATFVLNAIVTSVTYSLIEYGCYEYATEKMVTKYLYTSDVLVTPVTDSQWEGKESLYIFTIQRCVK